MALGPLPDAARAFKTARVLDPVDPASRESIFAPDFSGVRIAQVPFP
jgi:hypothetical protein